MTRALLKVEAPEVTLFLRKTRVVWLSCEVLQYRQNRIGGIVVLLDEERIALGVEDAASGRFAVVATLGGLFRPVALLLAP